MAYRGRGIKLTAVVLAVSGALVCVSHGSDGTKSIVPAVFAAGFGLTLSLSAVCRTEMQLWSKNDSAVVYVAVL